jgi:putative ABC transport system permease protein
MQFIKNKPLGFNRDLMQITPPSDKEEKEKLPVLKQQLLQYPEFSSIALSLGNPISGNAIIRFELEDSTFYGAYYIAGDYDLIKTMHLNVIEGQPFRPGFNSGKLVNETLVRHFNMEDPIGANIPGTEGNKNGPDKIIGVVKDFNVVSFKKEIPPYIISYNEAPNHLLIDISGKNLSAILPLVEKSWQEIYPDDTFSYKLIDDELMARHKEDTLFFRMIISFTVASVLISCFGLFGIAAFTAVQRTKEIGIRKILGASVYSILVLLSKDFVKLIVIAFVLAIPVANYFMREWLQNFAYKIEISWWMFIIPGLLVLLIALLSMMGQTLKAAHTNPVESLRNE